VSLFRAANNIPLVHVDAPHSFLKRRGRRDNEAKRKDNRKAFHRVFEAEAKKIGGAEFLAQGRSIGRDRERVAFTGGPSGPSVAHNVGGCPSE